MTRDEFDSLSLPYLYDLLDEDDRRQVEEHLRDHPEAAADLERAREHQGLLSEAVRGSFPEVRFDPALAEAKGKPEPTPAPVPPPMPLPLKQRLPVRWFAAAASLLFLVGGGGYLAVAGWRSHQSELQDRFGELALAETEVRTTRDLQEKERKRQDEEIRAVQEQVDRLLRDWRTDSDNQRKEFRQQKTRLFIQGPRSLQAGAANQFRIQVQSPKGAAPGIKPPDVTCQVVDPDSKKVLLEKRWEGKQDALLTLPPDLPVPAGRNLALLVRTSDEEGAPMEIRERLALTTPEYVTHLTTDRPMYRPGETVFYRSLTLQRFDLKPPAEDLHLRFVLNGPNGKVLLSEEANSTPISLDKKEAIAGPGKQPVRGIGAGQYRLPENLPGGEYVLEVSEARDRFPTERRRFLVNKYQTPRLAKQLTFDRSSYGPGERVIVNARAVRIESGQPLASARVFAQVRVDGKDLPHQGLTTDRDGRISWPFDLPQEQDLPRGDVSVSLRFDDGGNLETIVRPVPVVLKKLLVDFYPEGGDLVTGVENRVYFQARTTLGKPADVKGRIRDDQGKEVAALATVHDAKESSINQGLGSVRFTPEAGRTYTLHVETPAGLTRPEFPLPKAKADGVVLHAPQGVVDDGIPVVLHNPNGERQVLVGAYCRGKLLDHQTLTVPAKGSAKATLKTTPGVGGVYRITVFEKTDKAAATEYRPLAERLVFNRRAHRLDLTVRADRREYMPGERVKLTVETRDEKKQPVPSVLLVAVADLGNLDLADEKTFRTMPTHFLLTSEVRRPEDLEHADFFLGNHPRAAEMLDLLLGVQGWRRFAEQEPLRFYRQEPVAAARLLPGMAALAAPAPAQPARQEAALLAEVDEKFAAKFVDLQKTMARKESEQASKHEELQQKLAVASSQANTARQQIAEAHNRLANYRQIVTRLAFAVGALLVVVLAVGFLVWGVRRLNDSQTAWLQFGMGGGILALFLLGSVVGTILLLMDGGLFGRNRFERGMAVGMAKAAPPMAADMAMPAMPREEMIKKEEPRMLEPGAMPAPPRAVPPGPMPARPMPAPLPGPAPGGPPRLALEPEEARIERFGMGAPDMPAMDFAGPMGPMGGRFGGRGLPDAERLLRQQHRFQDLLQRRLGRQVVAAQLLQPTLVREYAFEHKGNVDGVRRDFAETLYWHPALVAADGSVDLGFDLSDSVTRFQVLAYAHTPAGKLGAATREIVSRLPYSIEPKVPVEITTGDKLMLPVILANDSDKDTVVDLQALASNLTRGVDAINLSEAVPAGNRTRKVFPFQAEKTGTASVRFLANFRPAGFDSIERTFEVVPDGFPVSGNASGLLEGSAVHEIDFGKIVPGTVTCKVEIFPNSLADLQRGLDSLLRQPCGCFEQASSSNYPNVLIMDMLKETRSLDPAVEQRARGLLNDGYGRLTSFECQDPKDRDKRGYEWFGGQAPPHEALTAYGLLQFTDMSRVHPVDQAMLARTKQYLLDQRDGSGGFRRNPRALDTFGRAPQHLTEAYIVWALTEVGAGKELDKEMAALVKKTQAAPQANDPYFLSLVGLGLLNRGESDAALKVLDGVAKLQKEDGGLDGKSTSITSSQGRTLSIETTALGVLAWLKANRPDKYQPNLHKAIGWLTKQRTGGGFGSTQSTILALKALVAYAREHNRKVEPGQLVVYVNDSKEMAALHSFTGQEPEAPAAILSESVFRPGKNKVRIELRGGKNVFPYTLTWSYRALVPTNPVDPPVKVATRLSKDEVLEGETVSLNVVVTNTRAKGHGMTVAIVGLPAGLTLPENLAQLKDLARLREDGTKPGKIAAFEIKGRDLVLYWRDLAPNARIELDLDLICRLPGEYRGPASRAYLYYDADDVFWAPPLSIKINPQAVGLPIPGGAPGAGFPGRVPAGL